MSIDIHPDGTRFVTGGQGEGGGGRISVWNLRPVIDETAEKNNDVPKLLAQMDHHLGCVNCVRWSFSGQMLASGGDDKLVMIWKKSAYGGGNIFGSKLKQVESWKLDKTLRSHEGDVLDLAWGPGDALLATASVDNNVIIWNAERFPDQVRILRGHTGLVKGVVFDPVGKYLASQSDDRTLRIWKTEDWSTEVVIKEPFSECGATTHVLRPGWSPEGSMLVSAHAMNGGGPTAQVVERGSSWKTQRDFVGHKKAVSCVRFCPSMLEKMADEQNGQKAETFVMVALGSRDRSFSVWTSSLQRPLFVIEDVFDQSVIDIAWSKDGKVLLSCSMDGSVAACVLTKKEIGRPYTDAELHALMVSKHGKNVGKATLTKNLPKAATDGGKAVQVDRSALVIENPELMLKAAQQTANGTNGASVAGGASHALLANGHAKPQVNGSGAKKKVYVPKGPTDKQIEARTPDGKRRITPIFIPPENEDTFGSAEFGSSSRKGKSEIAVEIGTDPSEATTDRKSSIQVSPPSASKSNHSNSSSQSLMSERMPTATPKVESEPKVNVIAVKKAPGPPAATAKQPSPAKPAAPLPSKTASNNDEEITSTKKKRKRILSSSSSGSSSSGSGSGSSDSSSEDEDDDDKGSPEKQQKKSSSAVTEKAKSPPPPAENEKIKKRKRIRPDLVLNGDQDSVTALSEGTAPVPEIPTAKIASSTSVAPYRREPAAAPAGLAAAPLPPPVSVIASTRTGKVLPTVKPFHSRTFKFDCQAGRGKANVAAASRKLVIEVTNNAVALQAAGVTGPAHLHSAEFRFNNDPSLTWRTVFGSAVASVEGGNDIICVICVDGSLHVYSSDSKGEKLLPPLQLPSPPTKINLSGSLLSIVTICGHLYVWDLDSGTSPGPTTPGSLGPRCLVSRENIEYLLLDGEGPASIAKLDHLRRSDLCQHRPVILTSAGKSYAFNKAMQVWMKISDASSLVQTASKFSKAVMTSSMTSPSLPLASLTSSTPSSRNVQNVGAATLHAATLAHCQDQKAAAQVLGSPEEFKFWTLNHIKELCEGGEAHSDLIRSELTRLRDEKHDFLSVQDTKEVLAGALTTVRSCLSLQRMFAEFEELEKSENEVSDLDKMILD